MFFHLGPEPLYEHDFIAQYRRSIESNLDLLLFWQQEMSDENGDGFGPARNYREELSPHSRPQH